MNKTVKRFMWWWIVMQLPFYGGLLYILLSLTDYNYWCCWLITNSIYAVIMFPFVSRIYKK